MYIRHYDFPVKPHPLVTNQYGTIGGRDPEDDESYRYRIQLSLSSKTGCSEPDLRAALLKVPGIQDVVFERLSGTYNVYVYGISPDVPPSLIDMVQAEIDRASAVAPALFPNLLAFGWTTRCRPWPEALPASRVCRRTDATPQRPSSSISAIPAVGPPSPNRGLPSLSAVPVKGRSWIRIAAGVVVPFITGADEE